MHPRLRSSVRRAALALAAVGCVGALPSSALAMTGFNLVVNGDGETAVGAEWASTVGGLARHAYGTGGYPGPDLIGGGTFAGGSTMLTGSGASTVARQTIPLTADDRAAIATGTVRARLSAYLGGYAAQADRMGIDATWRDAAGAAVLTQSLAPVTAGERGGVSGFLARQAEAAVPPEATSVDVVLTGTRVEGSALDGYADEVVLRLIGIPGLAASFGDAAAVGAGTAVPLEWTVTNSEDGEAKPPWSFEAVLPAGLAVVSSSAATSTCADARVRVSGARIDVDGALPAGASSCRVRVPVAAGEAGTYELAPGDVAAAQNLRAPSAIARLRVEDPPTTPSADAGGPAPAPGAAPSPPPIVLTRPLAQPPAASVPTPPAVPGPPRAADVLRVTLSAPTGALRSGRRASLRALVRNAGPLDLTDVDVCLRLPRTLAAQARKGSADPVDGRWCWSIDRLGGGRSRTLTQPVRGRRTGRAAVRLTAQAAEATGTTTTNTTVRVTR
jgi:hypothetical protein